MVNNRDEVRMHGNPEMHGHHDAHGHHGLSDWGRPDHGRDQTGYGNPPRFDQHGGQTGEGWHSASSGGMAHGSTMGGNYFQGGHQNQAGAGYGYQGGGFGGQGGGGGQFGSQYGGGQFGQGNHGVHGNHFGQGNARQSGNEATHDVGPAGRAGQPSDFDQGRMAGFGGRSQPQGFDQQRYGQQGLGSYGSGDHHDHDYRNWRDQQLQAFDREYEEFRRHRQERFNADFDEWRKSRGGPGSAQASRTERDR